MSKINSLMDVMPLFYVGFVESPKGVEVSVAFDKYVYKEAYGISDVSVLSKEFEKKYGDILVGMTLDLLKDISKISTLKK